jgi:hypothetical protein
MNGLVPPLPVKKSKSKTHCKHAYPGTVLRTQARTVLYGPDCTYLTVGGLVNRFTRGTDRTDGRSLISFPAVLATYLILLTNGALNVNSPIPPASLRHGDRYSTPCKVRLIRPTARRRRQEWGRLRIREFGKHLHLGR